jgi:hypothetical protein
MKIKLSKSQWEFVGQKAGWLTKTAVEFQDPKRLLEQQWYIVQEIIARREATGYFKHEVKKYPPQYPRRAVVITPSEKAIGMGVNPKVAGYIIAYGDQTNPPIQGVGVDTEGKNHSGINPEETAYGTILQELHRVQDAHKEPAGITQ